MLNLITKNFGIIKFILNEKEVIKTYFFYLFTNSLSILIPVFITPILIQNYSIESYGIMMLHQAVALFLSFLFDNGLRLYYIRLIVTNLSNPEKSSNIFFTFVKIKLFLAILLSLIYFIYIKLFIDEKFTLIAYSSILLLIGNILSPSFYLIGINKFNLVSLINFFARVLYLVLFFCLVYFDTQQNHLNNLFFGLSFIIGSLFTYIIIFIKYDIKISSFFRSKIDLQSIRKSLPLVVNNIYQNIDVYLHTFFISVLVSSSKLGIFIAIEKFYSIFKQALISLIEIYYPKICSNIQYNVKDAKRSLQKLVLYLNLLFIIIFVLVLLFKTGLSQFITNNSGVLSQNLILLFMVIPFAIINFNFKSHLLIMAYQFDKQIALISFYSIILKVILFFFLFHLFDIYGIILSLILVEFFVGMMKSQFINNSNNT